MGSLYSHDILPLEIKQFVKVKHLQTDKAAYYLDHVIKPSVAIGDDSKFVLLLQVMEKSYLLHVRELAKLIKARMETGTG